MRDRQIRGFGDAVVDHVARDCHAGFGRDKDNPPPALFRHAWRIVTRQTNAGKDVDVIEVHPLIIRNAKEIFIVENAQIIDQHISRWDCSDQRSHAVFGAEIGHHAAQ